MRALRSAMVVTALIAAAGPRSARALQARDLTVYYGAERATLGAGFGKLAFGGVETPELPPAQAGVEVAVVRTGRRLDGIDIKIPAESCAELESRLVQLWGPPNDDGWDYGEGWTSKSGEQAARFEGNSGFDLPCRLRFSRRVSPQQWLNGSRQSVVPLWAIGKPAAELEAAIAVLEPEHDDQGIHWQDTAIDGTRVTLSAQVRRSRVVGVAVHTEGGASTKRVWQRILAVFGKPDSATTDEDKALWRWRRTPGVEVGQFAGTGLPPAVTLPGRAPATPRPRPRTPAAPSDLPISISFGDRPRDSE